MVEPISVLAIATSAITCIDFTSKLISRSAKLYRNSTLLQHVELKAVAEQLPSRKDAVIGISETSATPKNDVDSQGHPVTFLDLRQAQEYLVRCADDVLEAIEKISKDGQISAWRSFRLALASLLGEQKLDALARRLADAREQYLLFLLLHEMSVSTGSLHSPVRALTPCSAITPANFLPVTSFRKLFALR